MATADEEEEETRRVVVDGGGGGDGGGDESRWRRRRQSLPGGRHVLWKARLPLKPDLDFIRLATLISGMGITVGVGDSNNHCTDFKVHIHMITSQHFDNNCSRAQI